MLKKMVWSYTACQKFYYTLITTITATDQRKWNGIELNKETLNFVELINLLISDRNLTLCVLLNQWHKYVYRYKYSDRYVYRYKTQIVIAGTGMIQVAISHFANIFKIQNT